MSITVMVVTVIAVTPKHTSKLNELFDHTLIYRRSKVGKTFLVKIFIDNDLYGFLERMEYLAGDKISFSKKEFDIEGVISLTPKRLFDLITGEVTDMHKKI